MVKEIWTKKEDAEAKKSKDDFERRQAELKAKLGRDLTRDETLSCLVEELDASEFNKDWRKFK